MKKQNIRNFSIIAHIDHGKSTLADRILEMSNSVVERDMKAQLLDTMDLERERGITIKLNSVQVKYKRNNEEYILNLIDTPGHVDFTYEVSRSLAASEGAILLVDSTQGVQPQTIANMYLALENNLEIIPVINKIDMEASDVEKTKRDMLKTLGIDASNAPLISAKTGLNVEKVFDQIIDLIPYPNNADDNAPLRALVFDSYFDSYKGIIIFVRIEEGILKKGDKIKFIQHNKEVEVVSVGINTPKEVEKEYLESGETGWVITNVKDIKQVAIGDTITHIENTNIEPLPGYKPSKPMVFSGFYPIETEKYQQLEDALEKISLSDSSLEYEKETSQALGFGFRVGFLGLLHMEIIQERIQREFNISLIATAPSVIYKINKNNGESLFVQNPYQFPDRSIIKNIEEPYVRMSIFSPQEYIGKLMEYVHKKRGNYIGLEIFSDSMNSLIYEIPMGEIVFDFFDTIKSISKGYASFDYEQIGYKVGNLVKMDILVAGEPVDALSLIIDKNQAYYSGRSLTQKLKDIIPRQNFEIPVQAAIGGKIIARETIKAYRKDVTGHLYGGDVSRKKKLLNKQKKGKKKMKIIGSVEVPQQAFVAVLKTNNENKEPTKK
ncbi:MAG: elongation factor 4 [Candidatus Tyloplasma litorale]|nr:MAG: elongation factor 4 [Mycoplasmatales bacterium]